MRVTVRLVAETDAAALAELLTRNRAGMAPWEPVRPDSFYTPAGQRVRLLSALQQHARLMAYPGLILVDDVPAGQVTLNNVVLGPFLSADLGYWVDEARRNAGVATAAVGEILRTAFDELGLHRVQAGTLLHNAASRRVLAHHDFAEIGIAPQYLHIEGRWQDHLLHQRLAPDPDAFLGL